MDVPGKIEELAGQWEQFKKKNDQRLEEIEARGHADPSLLENVEKLNGDISAMQEALEAEQRRADTIEKEMNRHTVGGNVGTADEEAMRHDARLLYSLTHDVPVSKVPDTAISVDAYQAYRDQIGAFIRYGRAIRSEMSVDSDPDGGYWVTPDMTGRMAMLVYETSPMREVSAVQSISTDALEGTLDLDQAGAGWVGERAARTETTSPQIGTWRVPVHEQYAAPQATQKLLDDGSIDVEAWLLGKIGNRFTRNENLAFISGSGVGQPRGLTTYGHGTPAAGSSAAWQVIERVPTGAAGAFTADESPGDPLVDLVYSLKDAYRPNARFLMARATEGEVRKIKDGNFNYIWQPNFADLRQASLLGFPITIAQDMPAIAANSLSIAFGDFRQAYQIVDRAGVRTLRDAFTNKPYVIFYSTKRVGGDVVNFEAVKLLRFAAAAS